MSTEAAAPRPMRADARRNRERVLAAAKEVFGESGLDAQVDEIARRAGVGVGTVYRHFSTKEELLEAITEQHFLRLLECAREAAAGEDAWDGFTGFLQTAAEIYEGDRAMQTILMDTPPGHVATDVKDELLGVLKALVRAAEEAGELRPGIEAFDVPMLVCGIGAAQTMPFGSDGKWRRMLAIIVDGLRAPGRSELPPR